MKSARWLLAQVLLYGNLQRVLILFFTVLLYSVTYPDLVG
jgi:hypothetical protein